MLPQPEQPLESPRLPVLVQRLGPVQAQEQVLPQGPVPEQRQALVPRLEPLQAGSKVPEQPRAATKRLHSYWWVRPASSSCIRQPAVPPTR